MGSGAARRVITRSRESSITSGWHRHRQHPRGDDLIAAYKERYGDKTLLAFSPGKDSIAVALALRDKIDVIPLHHDDLPGLEFVEESLAYHERQLFNLAAPAALACAAK